jgi:SAM-dependent methyltransferase
VAGVRFRSYWLALASSLALVVGAIGLWTRLGTWHARIGRSGRSARAKGWRRRGVGDSRRAEPGDVTTGRDDPRLAGGSKNLFYGTRELAGVRERVDMILELCEFRPTDHVLDVGCAEGLITLELARHVAHIHGFDLSAVRIDEAKRLAAEGGIANASFEVESVIGYPVDPLSYDVTIFAGVWGSRGVGFTELDNLLKATRRQLVGFIDVKSNRTLVPSMYEVCDRNGFDVLCFPGKFVVALRRGVEVSVPQVRAVAVVPTKLLADHPVMQKARSVEELAYREDPSSGLP